MATDPAYRFSAFRLDPQNWRLRKHDELRPLRPKTFAVLKYLLDNAGQLVTKEDLFKAVWPGVTVEQASLRMCLNELRQALDDDPHRPRFVETVHSLGYRFIAPVDVAEGEDDEAARLAPAPVVIVGREPEMARLREAWQRALGGTRQIVLVVGEPGIGKTTLVDRFLESPAARAALTGRGQCADQYGAGDAYLPIFDALAELCAGTQGRAAREAMLQHAPNWASNIPALGAPQAPAGVRRTTASHMLSELSAALSAMAAIRPTILVLEDLHQSDKASIELIAYLAKRRDPARLMIVGSYRNQPGKRDPAGLGAMVRELRAHKQCEAIQLHSLKEAEVADYLHRRVNESVSAKLVAQFYRRTGGNPLFASAVVDHLESLRGLRSWPEDLRELGVPDNVHAMIEQQIEELSDNDRALLSNAAIAGGAGGEFSSAALAAAFDDTTTKPDEIEERCERLTRHIHFLRPAGIVRWPDGTVAASYSFAHSLYQEVLYGTIGAGHRARAHLRVANRLQAGYTGQAGAIASELAMHFERGNDHARAASHFGAAAQKAMSRGAAREALVHLDRATKLLNNADDDALRRRTEFEIENLRLLALNSGRFAVSKIEASVSRLSRLAREMGTPATQMLISQGLTKLMLSPTEVPAAATMIATGLRQAESGRDGASIEALKTFQSAAHLGLAVAYNTVGRFRDAEKEANRAIETYDPRYPLPNTDSRVQATAELGMAWWSLGYRDRGRQKATEAIAMAEEISHPPVLAFALVRASTLYGLDRDAKESLALAERAIEVTADKDLHLWRSWGFFVRGWARASMGDAAEGCRMMRSALGELDSNDGRRPPTNTTHARAVLRQAEVEAGLLRVYEAMLKVQESIDESIETGNKGLLSDLYRILGSLQLMDEQRGRASRTQAEKSFRKAIETAREQKAKPLELRAALELSRAWQRAGKAEQARRMLSSIYRRFIEGHEGADLRAAKSLLEELK